MFFLFLVVTWASANAGPCVERSFGHSSHVCVCNSTYCDEYQPIVDPGFGGNSILHVVSDRPKGRRFAETTLDWVGGEETVGVNVFINSSTKYQSILGFGGAFTDAAGINIAKLSPEAQLNLIRSYYSPTGLEYNVGRINMGGCDFSDRPYTYVDTEGDVNLDTFSLTHDDLDFKIPYVLMAKEVSEQKISMFASPWSAPAWMKSNNAINGEGYLLEEYYEAWANYFIKFLDAYKAEGVEFWGLTAQNEPMDGSIPDFTFNCMGWNASTQTDWISEHLGPALHASGYESIKLMALDDQRPFLRAWAETIMANPKSAEYVSGWAVHWYVDFLGFQDTMDQTNALFPDKFIFYTEACAGANPWDLQKVVLGSWERGQEYINDIIENLNHWSVGWTDWNLALDMSGGPNWANNFVDAPIIVNPETDEFYKNPMWYALGHFSKFMPEGSTRIGVDITGYDSERVQMVGVERPDGAKVLVITNRHLEGSVNIRIHDGDLASGIISIGPESVHTLVWTPEQAPSIVVV